MVRAAVAAAAVERQEMLVPVVIAATERRSWKKGVESVSDLASMGTKGALERWELVVHRLCRCTVPVDVLW